MSAVPTSSIESVLVENRVFPPPASAVQGARIAGTVGLPLAGVAVRVVDPESGTALGPNSVGMIEVKGPNVFQGYWRMPEKTAEELRPDGWFITGDLGMRDADGYVTIVGRGKDMVISGGLNVYPKEVEMLIDAILKLHQKIQNEPLGPVRAQLAAERAAQGERLELLPSSVKYGREK